MSTLRNDMAVAQGPVSWAGSVARIRRPRWTAWTASLFIIALLQFCLFLNHRDITTAHEGRVTATAREMLARHDWITPYCNAAPRVAKPPLAYWGTMIAWLLAGEQTVWLARLPGALLGTIAVLLVMDLGRRILGQLGGIVSGLVWISTWFIVDEFRKAMADPYLAFFTLLSIWAWVVADELAHKGRRAGQAPRLNGRLFSRGACSARTPDALYLLCYLSAGIAALAKGHLILIHLACALIPYQLLRRRSPRRLGTHLIGIALLLVIGLPWPIYMLYRVPGAAALWSGQVTASEATTGAKFTHVYHYLVNLPMTAAPWTVFLIVGLLLPWFAPQSQRRRHRRHLWLIWWLGLTVLVFSLVPMKKNAYLDPVMPAQTLIIAAGILAVIRPLHSAGSAQDRWLMAAHAIAAAVALCIVLCLCLTIARFRISRWEAAIAVIALAILIAAAARRLGPPLLSLRTFAWTALGFALAVHGIEAWVIPNHDNRRSDRVFAQLAARDAVSNASPLIVIGPGLREDVLFYLDRTAEVVPAMKDLSPSFHGYAIVTADQLAAAEIDTRAHLIQTAAHRPPKDRLYLFRFD